jgi:hypothetical protein
MLSWLPPGPGARRILPPEVFFLKGALAGSFLRTGLCDDFDVFSIMFSFYKKTTQKSFSCPAAE